MGYGVSILVEGDYALFTRPELKTERYSYSVITPSAARGIVSSIYWKPQISYRINRIHVYNDIEFTNFRRNEVSVKASATDARSIMNKKSTGKGYINTKKYIQQRASTVLKNVKYIIEYDFEMTGVDSKDGDTPAKHYNMILRRLRKGQCFHQPYLGTREFPAKVSLFEEEIPESNLGNMDFGFMLYDIDFTDPNNLVPEFFHAEMKHGVIDLKNVKRMR